VVDDEKDERESGGVVDGESLCPMYVFFPPEVGILGFEFSCFANVLISGGETD
jgi:hypothetical protein